MIYDRSTGDKIFDLCNNLFMVLVIMVMIFPMAHVISVSLSDGQEVTKGGFFLYPRGLNLVGYLTVFKDPMLVRSYGNTILYSVLGTVVTLVFTCLTAYPLSIKGYKLKKVTTIYLTITMFLSGGMIPTYLLIRRLHLINTVTVMVLPFCVSAYNCILFRTFFQGIPPSLRESAMIDGAGETRILFQIIMPLSKAILATIGLFTLVGKWNDWFSALIYLTEEERYPVQMILRKVLFNVSSLKDMDEATRSMLRINKVTPQNIQMAVIVIVILPIMCVYPFLQKYFVKGVLVGTIKG